MSKAKSHAPSRQSAKVVRRARRATNGAQPEPQGLAHRVLSMQRDNARVAAAAWKRAAKLWRKEANDQASRYDNLIESMGGTSPS